MTPGNHPANAAPPRTGPTGLTGPAGLAGLAGLAGDRCAELAARTRGIHAVVLAWGPATTPLLPSWAFAPPQDESRWYDNLNPFLYLGQTAGKIAADAWTSAMLGIWHAGVWTLKLVFTIEDALLTPDLSDHGPGAKVYASTFWIAASLAFVLMMLQLGVAAFRRDGSSLATALVGTAQYGVVWTGWLGYCVVLVAACGGLTQALMEALFGVTSWSAWDPWGAFSTADIVDGTIATLLGLMGLLLWLSAIGHLLVMLTRAGSLIVLAATAPISSAGLLAQNTSSWFWKSLRWFHAAAFTPVIMTLTVGVGVQFATGVANGMTDTLQQAIGTALPSIVLILVSCFSPLALFKLLAFVDPGSSSGAALRRGLAAHGGFAGLLHRATAGAGTSGAASQTDTMGRSAAETAGSAHTAARLGHATGALGGLTAGGILGGAGGILGGAAGILGAAAGVMQGVGAAGAAIGSDLTNQGGIGHQAYHPDFSGLTQTRKPGPGLMASHGPASGRPGGGSRGGSRGESSSPSGGGDGAGDGGGGFAGEPPLGAGSLTSGWAEAALEPGAGNDPAADAGTGGVDPAAAGIGAHSRPPQPPPASHGRQPQPSTPHPT